jgi:hypothetical protein
MVQAWRKKRWQFAESSLGTIVHSRAAERALTKEADVPVIRLPLPFPGSWFAVPWRICIPRGAELNSQNWFSQAGARVLLAIQAAQGELVAVGQDAAPWWRSRLPS